MELNVLNKSLTRVGIVPQFTSLIWASRYVQNGDCELYLPATMENIDLLKKDYYLTRDDDSMVCVIRKIELTTDEEEGDMLIVTGKDVRTFLDQRIIVNPYNLTNASAEAAIRNMITWETNYAGNLAERYFKTPGGANLTDVAVNASLTDKITTQTFYGTVGDNVRSILKPLGWGGRYYYERVGTKLVYESYKGTDRHSTVKFSPMFHTMKSSDYVDDKTSMKNVTYEICKLQFQNWEQTYVQFYGDAASTDRYEQIIDKRSNSGKMTKAQIDAAYPSGSWSQYATNVFYDFVPAGWQFVVPPGGLRAWLEANYPGAFTFSTSGGVTTATSTESLLLARADTDTLASDTECSLTQIPFFLYILGMAKEDNAKNPEKITFTADIIPDLTFKYKEDYFLGDLVTIENNYGISKTTRITEVVESWDSNGYKIELKFDE